MSGPEAGNGNARYLIVTADDFGLSEGVNRGIIEAHENGIVTSASLMVRYAAAVEAAAYARSHANLAVGLHFDVGEWHCQEGTWQPVYEIINPHNPAQLNREFEHQLEQFEHLLSRKPTHLDSHQHIHNSEPARTILQEYSARLQLPLRNCTTLLNHRGGFYGQSAEGAPFAEGISRARLLRIIETLPVGWTEVACHPGYAHGLTSAYASEREAELRVLCSPQVREALHRHGVTLMSFRDYLALSQHRSDSPL